MREAGAKGKTKRKWGQGGIREGDEDRSGLGSRKDAPKAGVRAAGRTRAEIGLFVCDPKKFSF